MKTLMTMMLASLAGSGVCAAARPVTDRIAVCLEGGTEPYLDDAKKLASSIFLQAHVALEWHYASYCKKHQSEAIVITLSRNTPKTDHPGALAYALPFEGVNITIFLDRIQKIRDNLVRTLLAHVFVHEITHILQGLTHHSEEGIMKAHWTARDHDLMLVTPMSFTEHDIDLIHNGMKRPASTANLAPEKLTRTQNVSVGEKI